MSFKLDLPTIPNNAHKYFEANRNVLIIEDDKIMNQMVEFMLSDNGFEVTTASDGLTALEQLEEHNIDFIILDILLPICDGLEFYSRLKENPTIKNIPVMIISAWADEHHIKQISELGINFFLPKPFTEDELLDVILNLLVENAKKE